MLMDCEALLFQAEILLRATHIGYAHGVDVFLAAIITGCPRVEVVIAAESGIEIIL